VLVTASLSGAAGIAQFLVHLGFLTKLPLNRERLRIAIRVGSCAALAHDLLKVTRDTLIKTLREFGGLSLQTTDFGTVRERSEPLALGWRCSLNCSTIRSSAALMLRSKFELKG
jgi:hypothetical protein